MKPLVCSVQLLEPVFEQVAFKLPFTQTHAHPHMDRIKELKQNIFQEC